MRSSIIRRDLGEFGKLFLRELESKQKKARTKGGRMKFRGDDRELLRGLWSAVHSAGGSPSVNMIQKMARLAGASFDDKATRAVLFGDSKNTEDTDVAPQYSRTNTEVTPRREAATSNTAAAGHNRDDAAKVPPQYLRTNTEVTPRREAATSNTADSKRTDATSVSPQYLRTNTEVTPRYDAANNNAAAHKYTDATEVPPQYLRTNTEVIPRYETANNNAAAEHKRTDATKVPPQYSRTNTEVSLRREAATNHTDHIDTSATRVSPQYLRTNTEVTPKCEGGDVVDDYSVVDTPAPNLFDGLSDPLELESENEVVALVPASDAGPQEVPAPGIARLMELSKKAKAVNAAAAMRSAAKASPKAIRYIFPSERKL